MQSDPLFESLKRIVRRVLSEEDAVDYRGRYAARVVAQEGQEVSVIFDDERLKFKSGVRLRSLPGRSLQLAQGTRVLVAWEAGQGRDECAPFVEAVWLGSGGLASVDDVFSGYWKFDGPLVHAVRDLKAGHLLAGNSLQAVGAGTFAPGKVTPGAAIGTNQGEAVVSVAGGDLMSTIRVLVGTPPPAIPPGIVYTVTYNYPYAAAPQLFLWDKGGTGATLSSTVIGFTLSVSGALTPATQYEYTVLGVG